VVEVRRGGKNHGIDCVISRSCEWVAQGEVDDRATTEAKSAQVPASGFPLRPTLQAELASEPSPAGRGARIWNSGFLPKRGLHDRNGECLAGSPWVDLFSEFRPWPWLVSSYCSQTYPWMRRQSAVRYRERPAFLWKWVKLEQ
jgi:hypothetical protein